MARRAVSDPAVLAVLLVAFLAALSMSTVSGGGPAATDAPETIGRCTEITEPGVYVVEEEFGAGGFQPSQPCIRITADDVVIEGDGNVLDGLGATNTTGVQVVGADNVTVRNLRIAEYQRGVYFRRASGGELRNVTATSNVYGVDVSDSRGIALVEANLSHNLVGYRIQGDNSTQFEDVTIESNRVTSVREE